ncbi:hypothetical protein CUMW_008640 [Citrus unshiu]|nr:hypothetical protein CUMW_008640 [Citrus unshiu]
MNKIDVAKFTHIDAAPPPPSLGESEQRRSSSTTSRIRAETKRQQKQPSILNYSSNRAETQ